MSSDDRNQFVLVQEALSKFIAEEIGAASDIIGLDQTLHRSILVIDWICPNQITQKTGFGHFFEPIDFLDVL
jgi:hypothetical protein